MLSRLPRAAAFLDQVLQPAELGLAASRHCRCVPPGCQFQACARYDDLIYLDDIYSFFLTRMATSFSSCMRLRPDLAILIRSKCITGTGDMDMLVCQGAGRLGSGLLFDAHRTPKPYAGQLRPLPNPAADRVTYCLLQTFTASPNKVLQTLLVDVFRHDAIFMRNGHQGCLRA